MRAKLNISTNYTSSKQIYEKSRRRGKKDKTTFIIFCASMNIYLEIYIMIKYRASQRARARERERERKRQREYTNANLTKYVLYNILAGKYLIKNNEKK
jgi:hypothetical protein